MNETEIDELLKTFEEKHNQTASINLNVPEEIKVQKSISVLKEVYRYRIVELAVGIFVGLFLANFLYVNRESTNLMVSAAAILVFIIIAVYGCVRELHLILKFDYAQSVTQNQAILLSAQIYHIKYLRLAILQLPFYPAYILIAFKVLFDVEIWTTGNRNWLISNLIAGFILLPVSIWLYQKVQIKNIHLKWVETTVNLFGGEQFFKAIKFLGEIEKFKNE